VLHYNKKIEISSGKNEKKNIFVVHDVVSQHVGNGQMDYNGPPP